MRNRIIVLVAAILALATVGGIYFVDRGRNAEAYRAACEVRSAGDVILGYYSRAFKAVDINEVARYATDPNLLPPVAVRLRQRVAWPGPMMFGRSASEEARKHARAWVGLLSDPRGTWLTYTMDLATARRPLDAAILGLESWSGSPEADQVTGEMRARETLGLLQAGLDAEAEAAENTLKRMLRNPAREAESAALQTRITSEAAAWEAQRAADREKDRQAEAQGRSGEAARKAEEFERNRAARDRAAGRAPEPR